MQFGSDGFFGRGEAGDFTYFTPAHFIPILLLIAGIVLVYKFRERIAEWKWESRFRFIIAFILILILMSYYWRLMYVGNDWGYSTMLTGLPFDVCFWGTLFCAFMITSKNDTLFGLNFFLTLTLGVLPLLMPTVIAKTGPGYYRYYQFWIEHTVPILMTFYMMFVHGKRPKYRDIWLSYGFLFILAVPAVKINEMVPEANFLFLKVDTSGMGGNVTSLFPDSQYFRFVAYSIVVILMFHIAYYITKKITSRKRSRRVSHGI